MDVQHKYLFKVEIENSKGMTTYAHEFFGINVAIAEEHVRERFGPDVKVTFVKQTG